MELRSLRKAFVCLLTVVALWPVVQWYLVVQHDVNPWKLCGFAMYCTPHRVIVDVVDTTHGDRRLSREELDEASDDQYGLFVTWRTHLGTLHSPEMMARTILDSSPEIESLQVQVHVMQLDHASSHLKVRTKYYSYENQVP